jgi:exo-1,4-beta-D-glucosaminidase
VMNYENTRSFFEAWNAGENDTTFGTIFWMLNGVWPSVHWNLFDWYYAPGGGFFGAKKANEPVHIAYDYFTGRVVAYDSTLTARTGLTATATLYNIPDLAQQYTTQVTNLTVPADAATNVLSIPAVSGLSPTYSSGSSSRTRPAPSSATTSTGTPPVPISSPTAARGGRRRPTATRTSPG